MTRQIATKKQIVRAKSRGSLVAIMQVEGLTFHEAADECGYSPHPQSRGDLMLTMLAEGYLELAPRLRDMREDVKRYIRDWEG
jgi:hypothetical protein